MPRPSNITPPEILSEDDLRPLVGADGPDLTSAFLPSAPGATRPSSAKA